MNTSALLASVVFWISFAFSPGPFWAAWMNYHTQAGSLTIYKTYIPYLLMIFCMQALILSLLVQYFGAINPVLLLPLYFIGGTYILYYAVRAFKVSVSGKVLNFGFKEMAILSLSNPKVYLTVPLGGLSANYFADKVFFNGIIFALFICVPIMLSGSFFYAMLGKASAKLLLDKVKYFTSGLLLFYGAYLLFEGVKQLMGFIK